MTTILNRTHRCNDLSDNEIGQEVTLCGWVHTRRDHGGLIFVDLWDKHGITQVVLNPEIDEIAHEQARISPARTARKLHVGGHSTAFKSLKKL